MLPQHVQQAVDRLLRLLSSHGDLRKIIRLIQQDRRITLAAVFGSYARGVERFHEESGLPEEAEG